MKYVRGACIKVEDMYDPYRKKLIAEKTADWHCSLAPLPSSAINTANPLSPTYPRTKVWPFSFSSLFFSLI